MGSDQSRRGFGGVSLSIRRRLTYALSLILSHGSDLSQNKDFLPNNQEEGLLSIAGLS